MLQKLLRSGLNDLTLPDLKDQLHLIWQAHEVGSPDLHPLGNSTQSLK